MHKFQDSFKVQDVFLHLKADFCAKGVGWSFFNCRTSSSCTRVAKFSERSTWLVSHHGVSNRFTVTTPGGKKVVFEEENSQTNVAITEWHKNAITFNNRRSLTFCAHIFVLSFHHFLNTGWIVGFLRNHGKPLQIPMVEIIPNLSRLKEIFTPQVAWTLHPHRGSG